MDRIRHFESSDCRKVGHQPRTPYNWLTALMSGGINWIKPKSLRKLKLAGLPTDLHALLKPLKNEEFKTTAGRFNQEGYIAFLKDVMTHFEGKNTKRDATHLKYFATFEAMRESVTKAFKQYLQDPSQVICVMNKLRQEAASWFMPEDNSVAA